MANKTKALTESSKPTTKANVPEADADFGAVITAVATKWQTAPRITLVWTDAAAFAAKATAFNQALTTRNDIGSSRPQISQKIRQLDARINSSLTYIKGYLLERYKDAATSYYPSFGIEYKSKKYALPLDRNKRAESLRLMIAAIDANGLNEKEFGTAFWTAIKTDYDLLLGKATATDGAISTKVSVKNELKKELKKTLNCLIHIIKGNYPDTYKAKLRSWGLQKEKY